MNRSNSTRKQIVPFTQIVNAVLEDETISLKAKGLYAFMYSKPDNWVFHTAGLKSLLKEGGEAITTGLNELVAAGWVTRTRKRHGGKFAGYEYFFKYAKEAKRDKKHRLPVSRDGETINGKPAAENRGHSNTIKNKEREGFFSTNEKAINAYIKETIAIDGTIKNKRAYERKLLDKFMREDEATIYTFKQWLPTHKAELFTAKYKGKQYDVTNGEGKIEATLNRVTYNGGKFIAEFRANNGHTLHLSADDIERLQVFLKGGINANRE